MIGAAALVVGALAVTNQSLWIDEGAAALKAMEATLPAWWHNLLGEGNSNLQLLGELLYLWGWEKIFGSSEVALRASNIPFFAGGVTALAWGFSRQRARQNAIVLLGLTNAFLWYYLSEARPYVVLFCFASIMAACLFRLFHEELDEENARSYLSKRRACHPERSDGPHMRLSASLQGESKNAWGVLRRALPAQDDKSICEIAARRWFALFCIGVIGLCATSLIAVPWALGAMGAVIYWKGVRGTLNCALRSKLWSGLLIVCLGLLGLYYLWTLQIGARASGVGRTSWSNVGYIFYELSGLAGLGPGRLSLRAQGMSELAPFLPQLAVGAAAILLLSLSGFIAVKDRLRKRHILGLIIAIALPFALVFGAGVTGHMRLLGRHLTPLLPYLLALMALGAAHLFAAPAMWKRAMATAAICLLLFSSLQIRLAQRHRRDDYRSAAMFARQAIASGETVWWLADVSTGLYYQVPIGSPGVSTSPENSPDLVLLSKPDTYDSSGVARTYLAQHEFKEVKVLPAFQIFSRVWR